VFYFELWLKRRIVNGVSFSNLGAGYRVDNSGLTTPSSKSKILYQNRLHIGGICVALAGSRKNDVVLPTQLIPFQDKTVDAGINFCTMWKTEILEPHGRMLFDSGCTWRLYEHDDGLFKFCFYLPSSGHQPYKAMLADCDFSRVTVHMSETSEQRMGVDLIPLGYPLDELLIMHRLTQERAIELHGTGIVRNNDVANLFVGHSGAGKSTTTRLWTSREEVEVLSDDRIIVRYDDGRDGLAGPTAMRMYGTPWHGEAMFASPNSAPLTRIFVLEHGHGNVITRLTRSEAVGELFARAFVPFHRHEYIENALSFLEQLVSSVPCYRYSFEPTEQAVEKIQQFND
jgi:hypothetical protein